MVDLIGRALPEHGALTQRRRAVIVMAALAIVEAVAALLFAIGWLHTGADVGKHGVLVLPLLSLVLYFRAALLVIAAALYILFAWAALTGRSWAWPIGIVAVALDGLLVLTLLAAPAAAALRAIVPVVLLCYLVSGAGRHALRRPI